MKVILLILVYICCGLAVKNTDDELFKRFMDFTDLHKKIFQNEADKTRRYNIYETNLKKIEEHNKLFKQNKTTYEMGENYFTDMDFDEIKNLYMGVIFDKNATKKSSNFRQPKVGESSSPSKDWRTEGAISPVKDQGTACGSCWAFASVGALEAHYFLKYKKTIDLSEQHLINCVQNGCKGGVVDRSFDYIKYNGIPDEAVCPYKESDANCLIYDTVVKCIDYKRIYENDDEKFMKNIVGTKGPLAVYIHANDNFLSYSKGIYDDSSCTKETNHAVLVVGYGTENGQDYWLVKNSFGTEWGEEGYIRMVRNKNNQCGIASVLFYPFF